jgi:ABC-type transporter Mla MlaB component
MTNSLSIDVQTAADGQRVVLRGAITETANFAALLSRLAPRTAIDLSGVERINSIGVREWINFVRQAAKPGRTVTLEKCSPAVVEQLNMISDFAGGAQIRSVLAPFVCTRCNKEQRVELDLSKDVSSQLGAGKCTACGGPTELDDLPDRYLGFAK